MYGFKWGNYHPPMALENIKNLFLKVVRSLLKLLKYFFF
ncbi:Uncharacterized protein XB16_1257 [Leptospira santarosai]|uniref:Uncharacterized protein n=1 Tax=Leptospira santarosai TaxID=28183 RepID=A0A2P1QRP3_9LEPT|nr:Uncharacterized protein XB16_1257 [Leptospira santarosai]